MLPLRGPRQAVAASLLVLAAGLATARGMATHPAWAAAVLDAAHAAHLSPYTAQAFSREQPLPYPTTSVNDPSLPEGLQEVRTPGAPGALWQRGIDIFAGPRALPAAGDAPGSSAAVRPSSPMSSPMLHPSARPLIHPLVHLLETKVFSAQVLRAPRPAVVAVGTATDLVRAGGHFYRYARVLTMRATAYSANWASNGSWTGQPSAIGVPLAYGVVAVDPRVIPLGTRLYVQHYGLALAADTGSAIRGDRIDLFFWDTPRQLANFGIQTLRVYVINDPRLPPLHVPPALQHVG